MNDWTHRLIDANVVLAKQFTTGLSDASGNHYGNADVVFADDIENAPTVDAVKVVRCRNCKYGDWDSKLDDAMVCMRTKDGFWRSGNDFCSYGERKEDDDNC